MLPGELLDVLGYRVEDSCRRRLGMQTERQAQLPVPKRLAHVGGGIRVTAGRLQPPALVAGFGVAFAGCAIACSTTLS